MQPRRFRRSVHLRRQGSRSRTLISRRRASCIASRRRAIPISGNAIWRRFDWRASSGGSFRTPPLRKKIWRESPTIAKRRRTRGSSERGSPRRFAAISTSHASMRNTRSRSRSGRLIVCAQRRDSGSITSSQCGARASTDAAPMMPRSSPPRSRRSNRSFAKQDRLRRSRARSSTRRCSRTTGRRRSRRGAATTDRQPNLQSSRRKQQFLAHNFLHGKESSRRPPIVAPSVSHWRARDSSTRRRSYSPIHVRSNRSNATRKSPTCSHTPNRYARSRKRSTTTTARSRASMSHPTS